MIEIIFGVIIIIVLVLMGIFYDLYSRINDMNSSVRLLLHENNAVLKRLNSLEAKSNQSRRNK